MAFDSTADLLFRIGADSSDAEANIQRFRAIFGTNLEQMGAQFSGWAEKLFGDWSTASTAMIGGGAALAAGLVAAGGAAVHCANQYAQYVEEIDKGSRVTGIAIADMSGLKFAAESVGVNYDSLTTGLTRFTANVVKGAEGSKQQLAAFERLGISQDQLKAGEKDMLPLLESVSEHFKNLATDQDRVTEARDLFGRSGAQFLEFLKLGKTSMADLAEEARRLGLVIGTADVEALYAHQAAAATLKAEWEGVSVAIGRDVMPVLTGLAAVLIALPAAAKATAKDYSSLWGTFKSAATGGIAPAIDMLGHFEDEMVHAVRRMDALVAARERVGKDGLNPPPDKPGKGGKSDVEKTTEDYRGLSEVLDQVQTKMAKATSPEADIANEIKHLGEEASEAADKLFALAEAGKISPEDYEREAAAARAYLALIPQLRQQLDDDLDKKRSEEIARAMAARAQQGAEELIRGLADKGREEKETADKAQREQLAYQSELARLGEQRERIEKTYQTSEEKIEGQYAADVAKFDAAEEKKTLASATTEAQRTAIAAAFAAIRKALLLREGVDVQALHNSQGWQGIFGNQFAQDIKRNEALAREWASSTDQSLMMVKVSLESLKEMGQNAFQQLEQGMASNIVHAIIYKQSIGDAMKAATLAVLEQVAQTAAVKAIEALAWGFYDLATFNYPGAAAAFESAALFGSVAAAASIAGRALAPAQGGAGAPAAAGATNTAASAGGAPGGSRASKQGPMVTVNVYGHVYGPGGMQALAAAMNDAVLNNDVTLTATNVRTKVVVNK